MTATSGPDHPQAARPESHALQRIRQAIGIVNAIALAVSAAGVITSLVLIGWSVVMRYIFNRPPIWVDEVVGFLLVAIVTLAAADVLRRGEHIGVDIFTARLGPRGRRLAQAWVSLAALATALVFIVNGWQTAMFSRMLGIVTEGHFELPVFWLMLFLPLAGVLMLLTALEALLRLWSGASSLAHPSHLPGLKK